MERVEYTNQYLNQMVVVLKTHATWCNMSYQKYANARELWAKIHISPSPQKKGVKTHTNPTNRKHKSREISLQK